jgi:hypothetical protein
MSLSKPATRTEFKDFCLRRLGAPVLEINIDEDQVEDCVEEALEYYHEFHFDGVERIYLKHQVTADDKTNGYIPLNDLIIGVVNIFPFVDSGSSSSGGLFNSIYQIRLNDIYDLTNTSIVYYANTMSYIAMLDLLLNGQKPLRFNRHQNRLHIDMNWDNNIDVGDYIIVECYRALDPATWTDVWNDMWLKRYATALIKKQWATNIKKFSGITLPGGVTLDGDKLYDEAITEIKELEDRAQDTFSLPSDFMMG